MMTMGTLTSSESAWVEEVTVPYKWYEIGPERGGDTVGFSVFFGGTQHLPVKARPSTGGGEGRRSESQVGGRGG